MVYTGKIINPSFFRTTNAKAQVKKNVNNRGINNTSVFSSAQKLQQAASAQKWQQTAPAQTNQGSLVNNIAALTKSLSSFGNTIIGDNETVSQASGIAQGVPTDTASKTNLSSMRTNAESVVNNGDKYTPEYFREQVVNNTLNPYVEESKSSLEYAKADYNVLLGQKEQANENVNTLKEQVSNAESSKTEAQTTLNSDKKGLENAKNKRSEADKVLSQNNKEYESACQELTNAEGQKTQAQSNVSSSQTKVTQSETNLNNAKSELSSAEQQLANTPQYLEDGSPNPAYQSALEAKNSAQAKKDAAEQQLQQDKDALEQAKQELDKAQQAVDSAKENKENTLNKLNDSKQDQKEAIQNCKDAQKAVDTAQNNYDSSLKQFDNANNEYTRLNGELESSQGILTQCNQYEQRVKQLEGEVSKANELKQRAANVLQQKESQSQYIGDLKDAMNTSTKNEIMFNAQKSGKTGANLTPAENLMLLNGNQQLNQHIEGKQHVRTSTLTNGLSTYDWVDGEDSRLASNSGVINDNASFFEKAGCIRNGDGSYTNPNNGSTYVNVGDNMWLNTSKIGNISSFDDQGDIKYLSTNYLKSHPEMRETMRRMEEQKNVGFPGESKDLHIGTDQKGKRYLY